MNNTYNTYTSSQFSDDYDYEWEDDNQSTAPVLLSRETTPATETLYVNIDLGLRKECVRKRPPTYECIEQLRYDVEPKTGIFIPQNFTTRSQIDLLLYLHGHKSGFVSRGRDLPIDRFWDINQRPHFAFREILNNSGKNIILVAPTLGPLSQAGSLTTNDGFTAFVTQVIASLSQHSSLYTGRPAPSVRSIILACHSGGGEPMRRMARLTGSPFAGLIKECWGFDCTYSSRDPVEWYNWASANPAKSLYLFSIEGTSTARNAAQISSQGAALPNITLVRSRTTNHNSVPQMYMAERLSAVSITAESYDEAGSEGCGCGSSHSFYIPESESIEFTEDAPPPLPVTHQPLMVRNVPFAPAPPAGSYWPLRTANSAGRRVSYTTINNTTIGNGGRKFLAHRDNRDYNGSIRKYRGTRQNRWHVGIDLFANRGDEVVACEAGKIINLQYFYPAASGQRTYGILVEHSGCLVNYGEVRSDSLTRNNLHEGDTVAAGQVIGFVSDTDMLHFETYSLREDHTYHNLQWWNLPETPNPPDGLLNPTQYLLFLQQNGLPLPAASSTVSGNSAHESYDSNLLLDWQSEDNTANAYSFTLTEDRPVLTYDALRSEYATLFTNCTVNDNRVVDVDAIIQRIFDNQTRYEAVGQQTSIPWYFIGIIHNMEASLRFTTHLHNGDPLTARTVHVPRGRPISGTPPFTWEDSAVDALTQHRLDRITDWNVCRMLFEMERYNGWGYRRYHPTVNSPYLWSFSNQYTSGKYVADGRWSATAVSAQAGGGTLLKRMMDRSLITVAV